MEIGESRVAISMRIYILQELWLPWKDVVSVKLLKKLIGCLIM